MTLNSYLVYLLFLYGLDFASIFIDAKCGFFSLSGFQEL